MKHEKGLAPVHETRLSPARFVLVVASSGMAPVRPKRKKNPFHRPTHPWRTSNLSYVSWYSAVLSVYGDTGPLTHPFLLSWPVSGTPGQQAPPPPLVGYLRALKPAFPPCVSSACLSPVRLLIVLVLCLVLSVHLSEKLCPP